MAILGGGSSVGSGSARGMNAFSLVSLVARRVPGFDPTEYLSEINDCYEEVWSEIQQIDEMYFADTVTFTTTTQTDLFDLVYDNYASLGGSIPRLHQIHRIRINQPGDNHFNPVSWRDLNDPEFLGRQTLTSVPGNPVQPRTTPAYLCFPFGEGSLRFAEPLPVGVQIEVYYTFKLLDLQVLSAGTVSTNGKSVTGAGTNFTQLVPANMQQYLPGLTESNVEAEIIINGQTYRVVSVGNDSSITVDVAPPGVSQASYILASVPELPAGVHRVISTLATRNILTTPAEDERFAAWSAKSTLGINMIKNTLIQRQRQDPPKKKRFPHGTSNRARFFGVK